MDQLEPDALNKYPEPSWVRHEIPKVQTAKSGHVYLELEQRSEQAHTIASTTGVIWKERFPRLDAKFAEGTGDHLMRDIKVLVRVRAEFHPVHGFDLIIDDIDPSYTLGDLLAQLNHIRATLKAKVSSAIRRRITVWLIPNALAACSTVSHAAPFSEFGKRW